MPQWTTCGAEAHGSRQPGGLVARRSAGRRLRGAASREGAEAGPAGARLRPRRQRQSAAATAGWRGDEHAVAGGVRRELGSAGRLPRSMRCRRQRRRLVADARIGSGQGDVGLRRPARAADDELGLERRDGGEDPDADVDGGRRATSRCRLPASESSTRTWPRARRSSSISAAPRTTRCGRRTTPCCSSIARVADARHGERREGRMLRLGYDVD